MSNAKLEVLTPRNSQLIIIDHQPQMAFGVQSMDRQTMKNNVVGLAKAAKIFDVPTTITTVESESFSGYTYPNCSTSSPASKRSERTSMNSWDDQKVRDALAANGRKKIVVAGLWTEVCNTTFALSAMLEGDYEIYMVADASGGTTKEAHDYAMQRMIQAGVVPVTWQQVLLEWQRDWKNKETYDAVMAWPRNTQAPTAWASTTPTRWSTRPRNARRPRIDRADPCAGDRVLSTTHVDSYGPAPSGQS
jgi:nicotinamidase-related amidase